ncbi:MAG: sugar ABC transporter permease, partial [Methylobacterium sp.]|nr:sugar ABC transporter permease [Methylobacterium sp.]
MKHATFLRFFLPTATAMVLFIALPIVSVLIQSVHVPHDRVVVEVENCTPFGCTKSTVIDQAATQKLRDEKPLGRFVGLAIYTDRSHLAFAEIGEAWSRAGGIGDFLGRVMNLPFYRALAFTLTYMVLVTPLSILLGFVVAVAVNAIPRLFRGPVIFFSLLP